MSRKVDTKLSTLEKKTWGFVLFEEDFHFFMV